MARSFALAAYSLALQKVAFYTTRKPLSLRHTLSVTLADRAAQPKEPSAGSCFKNPSGDYAGRLIEAVDLRGARRGGAAFSDKRANFLVNLGGASFDDAIALIGEAKRRVLESFNIALELEIKVV